MMGTLNCDSSKLYQNFNVLQIHTGKLGHNEISAWRDTFNQTQKNFLDWFENSITTENCELYTTSEAYQTLADLNLAYDGIEYKEKLAACQAEYPDLFYDKYDQFEIELQSAECDYYDEEEEHLERDMTKATHKNKKATHQFNAVLYEVKDIEFITDEFSVNCIGLADELDKLNSELHEKFLICCNSMQLQVNSGQFLCDIDIDRNISLLLTEMNIQKIISEGEKQAVLNRSLNSTLSDGKTNGSFAMNDWEQNILADPKFKVIDNMTVHFVKTLQNRTLNLALLKTKNLQLKWIQLQANKITMYLLKQNITDELTLRLTQKEEDVLSSISGIVKDLIVGPIIGHKKELPNPEFTNEILVKMEEHFNNLIRYQSLWKQFLFIYDINLHTFSTLMNTIRPYLSELQRCEERTEAMRIITSKYNIYAAKPFEQKWHLFPAILKIIGSDPLISPEESLQALQTFDDKWDALEHKIFIGDVETMGTKLQNLDKNNRIMANFLSHPATNTINLLPNDIYYALKKSMYLIAEENKFIKYSQNIPKEMSTKFDNNKWLKLKRQLWMYFLRKPTKMQSIISEIEEFVGKKRSAYFNSEI